MSYLSNKSEQKNLQRNFVSDQSVFDALVAPGVDVQLTDEQRWWRHRVRCCFNRRYVLACSQVCAWSTDLSSTCLQVIESVVRVLGIEKRPKFVPAAKFVPGVSSIRIHSKPACNRWSRRLLPGRFQKTFALMLPKTKLHKTVNGSLDNTCFYFIFVLYLIFLWNVSSKLSV